MTQSLTKCCLCSDTHSGTLLRTPIANLSLRNRKNELKMRDLEYARGTFTYNPGLVSAQILTFPLFTSFEMLH
jgi:hypothetical protein